MVVKRFLILIAAPATNGHVSNTHRHSQPHTHAHSSDVMLQFTVKEMIVHFYFFSPYLLQALIPLKMGSKVG